MLPLGERINKLKQRKQAGKLGDKGKNRLDRLRTKQYGKRFDKPADLPYDAQYDTEVARINRDYGLGQLENQGNWGQYTANMGAFDPATGLADPTNPYSRANLLQQNYQTQQRGSMNSYAAGGQLYSGALQNASNANVADFEQQKYSWGQEFQSAARNQFFGRLEADNARLDALQAAEAANTARAAAIPVTDAPPRPGYVKRTQKAAKQTQKQAQKKKEQFVKSHKGGAHGAKYQAKLERLRKKNQKAKKAVQNIPNEYRDRP